MYFKARLACFHILLFLLITLKIKGSYNKSFAFLPQPIKKKKKILNSNALKKPQNTSENTLLVDQCVEGTFSIWFSCFIKCHGHTELSGSSQLETESWEKRQEFQHSFKWLGQTNLADGETGKATRQNVLQRK